MRSCRFSAFLAAGLLTSGLFAKMKVLMPYPAHSSSEVFDAVLPEITATLTKAGYEVDPFKLDMRHGQDLSAVTEAKNMLQVDLSVDRRGSKYGYWALDTKSVPYKLAVSGRMTLEFLHDHGDGKWVTKWRANVGLGPNAYAKSAQSMVDQLVQTALT